MSETKIEWADYTFNPWIGCTKVSEGCANCYAERDFDKRRGYAKWGSAGTRVKTSEANWNKPRAWNRKAEKEGVRYRVFCASLSDVFEDWQHATRNHNGNLIFKKRNEIGEYVSSQSEFPSPPLSHVSLNDLRRDLFELIDETPFLDWLLVTKRPENILKMWPDNMIPMGPIESRRVWAGEGSQNHRHNVWLVASVENQEQADKRIPELLKCRDLSPVLGLSCEPLLGPVDLTDYITGATVRSDNGYPLTIDWVIAGGESGPNARPMHPDWIRSLCGQCDVAEVPFFFKQWGEWCRGNQANDALVDRIDRWDGPTMQECWDYDYRFGKQWTGRELDGVEWSDFPEVQS